jgi:beta-1,4-N-acetylglucosaminyltransferase
MPARRKKKENEGKYDASGGGSGGKMCFVTVGTTNFNDLIVSLDQEQTLASLRARGFTELVLQIGHGAHEPSLLLRLASRHGVAVEFFRFSPTLQSFMERASLVISHAGAGSILEAMRAEKQLLVVVNESLMGNHQVEVAKALCAGEFLTYTTPDRVQQELRERGEGDFSREVYPAVASGAFGQALDAMVARKGLNAAAPPFLLSHHALYSLAVIILLLLWVWSNGDRAA